MKSSHSALLTAVLALSMLAPGCAKQEPAARATATDEEANLAPTAAASAATATTGLLAKERSAADPYAAPVAADGIQERKPEAPGAMGIGGGGARAEAKVKAAAPVAPTTQLAAPKGGRGDLGFNQGAATGELDDSSLTARPAETKLDPNARYATTYRPGGAALAAFDSAVTRGDIPAEYKDLVGDFGSRYAPTMEAPKDSALSFKVETERDKLAPAGGLVNVRIAMRSSAAETARAPLSVHLVLDVSGSMSGLAIENARKAAASLVERLAPTDDFSMVTFSNSAEVLVQDGPVGPRRKDILGKIEGVRANGGTNISSGLDLGYAQAHDAHISPEAVKIVMLLSDGHANGGDTRPEALAERSAHAFQDGIQTSSFGLGADFDAPLMSSIADRGAGGYYFLADSSQIAGALAKEMDSRLVPAALGVEVRVRLRPDIVPVRVYGSRELRDQEAAHVRAQEVAVDKNAAKKQGIARDRQEDAVGGMRFFMPAFAKDDRHAILMQVRVPAGTGERPLASVEVKYKDRIKKKNVTDELAVKIAFAKDDAESAASANASVVSTVQAFTAGDSIVQAERMVDAGQRVEAMRLLQERAELLKRAAVALGEARLGEDAIRLARLSRAVGGDGQVKDALPLAVLLRGSAYGYLK